MDGKTGQTNAETRRVQKSQLMLFCSDFQEADYNHFHLNPALNTVIFSNVRLPSKPKWKYIALCYPK